MTLSYSQVGDYLIPNITTTIVPIPQGQYAKLRRDFLKEHKKGLYAGLLLSDQLNQHLQNIQDQAQLQIDNVISYIESSLLKPDKNVDPIGWINFKKAHLVATNELILKELVYV